MTAWYEVPAANALISALFQLDAIASTLEPFASQFGGEDPACVIGSFNQNHAREGLAHGWKRSWQVSGGSATEACYEALGNIRSASIEAQAGAKWATATQTEADQLMQADGDTPTVDQAINAYRRKAVDLRRVA